MTRARLVTRESKIDAKAVLNLFSDWLDSSTPVQLGHAGRWLEEQAKMRRYPGAVEDLRRVNDLIRRAMGEQNERFERRTQIK